MNSLALSDVWDLTLTPGGNLAVISDAARVAQGEGWYDGEAGVPYLLRELAALPPAELVRARADRRALEVPGVAAVQTTLTAFAARILEGSIRVTTTNGEEVDVAL